MLIHTLSHPTAEFASEIHWLNSAQYNIGWKGLVYLAGEEAGEATISRLLAFLETHPIEEIAVELHGVFGIFIHDKRSGVWKVFGDNSGLYKIFYNNRMIATRFLEIGRSEPDPLRLIDPKAIVEFIAYGINFGRHTPLNGIFKLRRDDILELDPALGTVRRYEKTRRPNPSAQVEKDGETFVLRFFDDLAQAFGSRRVSIDVTGGFDSRAIVGLLAARGLGFECAIAGVPKSADVEAAQRVALTLGRELCFHEHNIDTLEEELPAAFLAGDGLMEMPRLHRNWQMARSRLNRGVEVMVHGGGGEFFRDHYFVQDFPRYGSSSANIARYHRLRFAAVGIPDGQLTDAAETMLADVRRDIVEKFEKLKQRTNNLTYDRIFYEYRVPDFYGTTFSNYVNMGLDVAAPFTEHDMFRVATAISPWRRTFMLWHRRIISRHAPALATLRTAEGYTASSAHLQMLRELGNYVRVQGGRIARKLGERHIGKTLFHRVGALQADAPGYRAKLRQSRICVDAVERLKECGVLSRELDIATLKDAHVGRIMTMGSLLGYLERSETPPADSQRESTSVAAEGDT